MAFRSSNLIRCLALIGFTSLLIKSWMPLMSDAASLASSGETDLDNVYRLLAMDPPCMDERCFGRAAFKRTPNELVINRDNLVTLLRHIYPKAAFTSPFLGKRSWNKVRFDASAEKR